MTTSQTARDPAPDGWAAHDQEQRRAWRQLTPAQRLAWLEEAKEFAAQAHAAVMRRRVDKDEP
jgi:hypothetical protein